MLEKIEVWSKLDALKRELVLSNIFGLTYTEACAYFEILEDNTINVQSLAERIGRDRTTSQRILAKLVDKELAYRRKINLAKGGIKYSYEALPFSHVKQKMLGRLDTWHSLAGDKIRTL